MAVVSLQMWHNPDSIVLNPHHYFIYRPHVMTKLSMQRILKFVKDCDTLIIHFWSLSGFKPNSEPLSVYSFSGCFYLSPCSSLELSQFPALMPRNLTVFLSLASPFFFFLFLSPHLCSAPSPRSVFPLFFPPLSPGNQTSGEECWVSTFPEKRTIWATQRPTMDPLCSLLPALCHCTAAHTYTQTQKHTLNYIKTRRPSACYPCLLPISVSFHISLCETFLHLCSNEILSCFTSASVLSPYIFWCSH